MHNKPKKLVILGATGSIGTQALDLKRRAPQIFDIVGLSAYSNLELLKKQISEFQPRKVAIKDELQSELAEWLGKNALNLVEILAGEAGLYELAGAAEADLVVNGLVGQIGVEPTLAALKNGKNVALANKEALVCAGEQIMLLARAKDVKIIPIDSEHSAIFQCLEGRDIKDVEKIVLTCSGGPFRGKKRSELAEVTVEEALKHPTWKMGPKITVDCATLVNKGLEVIEAMYLFDLKPEQIEVVIHPQSLVHGLVYFRDGTVLMQSAVNDMRIPIAYALNYPKSRPNDLARLELTSSGNTSWTFEKPDLATFQGLALAYEAARRGGDWPRRFNDANEEAVQLFLAGKIKFLEIYDRLRSALDLGVSEAVD